MGDLPILGEEMFWCSASPSCGYLIKPGNRVQYTALDYKEGTHYDKDAVILKKITSGKHTNFLLIIRSFKLQNIRSNV